MMPNFLFIGPPKTGSTALVDFLGQHPQVFISPVKEPGFFMLEGQTPWQESSRNYKVTRLEEYQQLFAGSESYPARGEASTRYLSSPRAVASIHWHLPEVKLITMLRDPAERAFSEYIMYRLNGLEQRATFSQVIEEERVFLHEMGDLLPGSSYVRGGLYETFLARYRAVFAPQQMLVLFYEDYLSDPQAILKQTFSFLGVEPQVAIQTNKVIHKSGLPRSGRLYELFKNFPLKSILGRLLPRSLRQRLRARIRGELLERPVLSKQDRASLVEIYRPEIDALERTYQRDLSAWK